MLHAAMLAVSEIVSPPFRSVMWRSLGLTLALLVGLWFAAEAGLRALTPELPPGWENALEIIAGILLFVGLGFLVAPVTALFAGLFLDEIAEVVERENYPADPPGRSQGFREGLASALRFTALVIAVNILMLPLLLLPGVHIPVFFAVNAYFLGREYFEGVAIRFLPRAEVTALRDAFALRIFLAGLLIAVVLAVPVVNLFTPLFATAFMVHVFKELTAPANDGWRPNRP